MSEGSELAAAGTPSAETAPSRLSFGPQLAAAREALGLTISDIAARLRLSPKQVAAIESENLTALPEAAFVRGFVRAYAKEVRLDAAPLVDAFSRTLAPVAETIDPSNAQGLSPLVGTAGRDRAWRSLVIAAAVGAIAVFAVVGWFATPRTQSSTTPAGTPAVAAAPTMPATALTTVEPLAAPLPPALTAGASTTEAVTSVAADVASQQSGEAPAQSAGASGPDVLRFGFREASWVEVTDEGGRILLSQINAAGTEETVRGKPPYRLVIGNASAVSLEFGGKTVDLKPVTSVGNVARLTLP